MNVYAFDIDECLEISNGPVSLQSLMDLRIDGHIVGLCGNWACLTLNMRGWQHLISFMNCVLEYWVNGRRADKSDFLKLLKRYVPADDHVMVGNVFGEKNSLGFVCGSHDSEAAIDAGWRFIKEDSFAAGER